MGKGGYRISRQSVQNRQSGGTRNLSSPRRVSPVSFLNYENLQIMSLVCPFLFSSLLLFFLLPFFCSLISSSVLGKTYIYQGGTVNAAHHRLFVISVRIPFPFLMI